MNEGEEGGGSEVDRDRPKEALGRGGDGSEIELFRFEK